MYTSNKIKQHTKCLCALEMIGKVNGRIETLKDFISKYDNAKILDPITLIYKRSRLTAELETAFKIQTRLVNYYNNLKLKL